MSQLKSQIFCGSDGNTLQIYISINGVIDRPRVCRMIKMHGGHICDDAIKAQIILIEPSTHDGKEMIRFRGKHQPVLGYRWVEKCIGEKRLLGADENWGGYRVHDDGDPLELRAVEDEELDLESSSRNILPTPRITPTSPADLQSPSSAPSSAPSYQPPPLPFGTPTPVNSTPMQLMPAMYQNAPFSQPTQPMDNQAMAQLMMYPAFQAFMMNTFQTMSQSFAAPPLAFASGSITAAPPPNQQQLWKGKGRATQPESLNPIFREDGKPFTFFVQVDLKNRVSVISNIKKYGGTIINSNCDADYAILHSGSKMFPQLLSATIAAGRPAVKATFITDSIASGELEDISAYLFDMPSKQNKRAATNATEIQRAKRKSSFQIKTEQEDIKPSLQPQIGIRSAVKKRRTSTPTPTPARNTPSPTPPPESSRVEMTPGRYRYSDDEQAYMYRYFEYLLRFDPSTTTALAAKRLHEKIPHHTIKSWLEYLRTNRAELDVIRKRVGIARRKAQQLPSSQHESPLSYTTMSNTTDGSDPFETDMDHFCRFFALGSGDNIPDEEVWGKLDQLHKCLTAQSWAAFNDLHNKIIFDRVKEMTRAG